MSGVRDLLADLYNDELLFLDPPEDYDHCIMGVAEGCAIEARVIYDAGKVIESLMKQGMSEDDAEEYFAFNIVGAYVGEHTPLFMHRYVDL